MLPTLYLALVHHPVRAKDGSTMTTAVTNLDVHDLARLSRSYGVARAYLVTPITAQQELVSRILEHWEAPGPQKRIPQRTDALRRLSVAPSLQDTMNAISARHGQPPTVYATAARSTARQTLGFDDAQANLFRGGPPVLVVFGTGHGLTDEVLAQADELLAPIRPGGGFNHLSVRTAMAICLDRLVGDRELSAQVAAGSG